MYIAKIGKFKCSLNDSCKTGLERFGSWPRTSLGAVNQVLLAACDDPHMNEMPETYERVLQIIIPGIAAILIVWLI
jgi:hypothetical protein